VVAACQAFQPLYLIFDCYPAIPRAIEERSEPANRLGVLVFFTYSVRICTAPPLGESDYVSWSILIDENLMRDIAVKASHVGPHLTREAKPLFFRTGF
jgi:hypothetical protein